MSSWYIYNGWHSRLKWAALMTKNENVCKREYQNLTILLSLPGTLSNLVWTVYFLLSLLQFPCDRSCSRQNTTNLPSVVAGKPARMSINSQTNYKLRMRHLDTPHSVCQSGMLGDARSTNKNGRLGPRSRSLDSPRQTTPYICTT